MSLENLKDIKEIFSTTNKKEVNKMLEGDKWHLIDIKVGQYSDVEVRGREEKQAYISVLDYQIIYILGKNKD